MSDPITEAFLRRPSPLIDPGGPLDEWATFEGGTALVLRSGDRPAARLTTSGEGVRRFRIGPAAMPDDSSLLRPGYVDADVNPGVGPFGGQLHGGPFAAHDTFPFPAGARIGGDRPGWLLTCYLAPNVQVYGGGESFHGPNLRGHLRHCVNVEALGASGLDRAYLNVPFFWSDAGWGVFFHTGTPMVADLGSHHSEIAAFAVEGEGLDVFVFHGSPIEVIQRYLSVTGLPGSFPTWALGVWSSRCSYLSAAEVEGVVRDYEDAGAPLDVVHVDAWLKGNVVKDLTCSWEIDRDRFPTGWTKPVTAEGVRASLWHNPYVLEDSPAGRDLIDAGLLLADGDGNLLATNDMPLRRVIDLTAPAGIAWWKDKIVATMETEGNAAFKPDFAEEIPPDAACADGRTGWQVRNEYAVLYQRATYEAMRDAAGDDAIALFCRSGTAGAQRYPCHWVGDTPSTWTGLATALRACLSLSLSGFGFVSHDIGGFWTKEAFAHSSAAFEQLDPSLFVADVDPELYARWAQWGAVSPVMRFHGTGRREPFAYPEPFRSSAIAACRLRRELQPYLVMAAAEASTSGVPMMRPMVLAAPDDRAARDAQLQYLLGPDMLVAPVLGPGGRTEVYVPAGRWQPLVGLEPVDGPGWLTVDVPIDAFPVWVRAGRTVR